MNLQKPIKEQTVQVSDTTQMPKEQTAHQLIIYTDGAARGNPGKGGYGVVLLWGDKRKELSGGYRHTTNNRMELMAVIVALASLTKKNIPVSIYTDSQYVVNTVEKKWLDNWIRTDFKGGKKNKDLWLQYHAIAKNFTVRFYWVKGHATNPMNNRCDELATQAADGGNLLIDEGYEEGL
jgi:ribonuclease HI